MCRECKNVVRKLDTDKLVRVLSLAECALVTRIHHGIQRYDSKMD